MARRSISIRHKITFGFYTLLFFVIGTVLITYTIALQVEDKVFLVEVMDDFYNVALETRRFEKNYFLYIKQADYLDNQAYITRLHEMLNRHRPTLEKLAPSGELLAIESMMLGYQEKMLHLHQMNTSPVERLNLPEKESVQKEIRELGKQLTEFAKNTAKAERESIKQLLKTSRTVLIASALLLIAMALSMATLLGRKVVASLKLLEDYTNSITQGKMIDPPERNAEEEIKTVFRAFNRMMNELRLRQRQLVQSEKLAAMGTLVAGVAHELNNPLSNISSSAQIMAEELDDPDIEFKRTMIAQIEEQTDKARDIVRTLLEFSRTKEFMREPLKLRSLIQSTIQLMRSEIKSLVTIHVEVPEDLIVIADKQRLQQVFLNLIKNGVDALGGEGNIWISAKRTTAEQQRNEVEVMIEDDGPGIDPAILHNIFDPFFTTKDVGKGSGLGLFVVHDIVEAHGGTITVDSRLDQGTTFVIWLPGEGEK